MKILVTGGCGFVGTNLCLHLKKKKFKVISIDNLSRKGSKYNLNLLKNNNIKNFKIDIANFNNLKKIPKVDLIIDCCAEAAVEVSKRELDKVFFTNLVGTFNILKKAKIDKAKLIFLSSSRVYPLTLLSNLVKQKKMNKKIKFFKKIDEKFSLDGPRSIYGFTKLSSEMLIEEFSYQFGIKFIINRCGVISGPLQFGKQDQGFVSLWLWRHLNKKKLNYIGYGGKGHQVRDVLHIDDLKKLIFLQIKKLSKINNKIFTVGGSIKNKISLIELTKICQKITGNEIKIGKIKKTSNYDIPIFITNNSKVSKTYGWKVEKDIYEISQDVYKWLSNNKKLIKKYF
jgi:CDP-paratose 2-epimerase|tara:strand:- start:2014 stop:3036 length:1023 start_codon:yes stop_codon:yes gene_type:complete